MSFYHRLLLGRLRPRRILKNKSPRYIVRLFRLNRDDVNHYAPCCSLLRLFRGDSACLRLFSLISLLTALTYSSVGLAHPNDEFCGDGGMDPLLCAELAALDAPLKSTQGAKVLVLERNAFDTFSLYVRLGIEHIIPDGQDHLLFIFALLLSTPHFKRLLLQISLFTLAHSITLFLAVLSLVSYSSVVIEVLIALSIAVVGIENIIVKRVSWWRSWLIFLFGLLHGLGFAGALRDLGLSSSDLVWSLVGFNIGVEVAQLLFAALIFALLCRFMHAGWYRNFLVIPSSACIAVVALWWAFERGLGV